MKPQEYYSIGFYIGRQSPLWTTPFEVTLLTHIIHRALDTRSILVTFADIEPIPIASVEAQTIGIVAVSNRSLALRTIAGELDAIGVRNISQIAWRDRAEDYWRDDWPSTPVVPFKVRFDGMKTRAAEAFARWKGALPHILKAKDIIDGNQPPPAL